ncbi:AFG1/ZapE family ATPase, partial [Brucella abortus]|nr:AFG1/ZapE family ATPase [Brucella abortus]
SSISIRARITVWEKLDRQPVYLSPLGLKPSAAWMRPGRLTRAVRKKPDVIHIKGRDIEVPRAAAGAARFSFDDLCARPLGASDYIAIANRYPALFIDNVPVLDYSRRNEAKAVYSADRRALRSSCAAVHRFG